jgi:hypothetical protein
MRRGRYCFGGEMKKTRGRLAKRVCHEGHLFKSCSSEWMALCVEVSENPLHQRCDKLRD